MSLTYRHLFTPFLLTTVVVVLAVTSSFRSDFPSLITLTEEKQSAEIQKEPRWLTIEQAQDSMRVKPKKIFIKIYTDWCHVCRMLDRKTLCKPRILKLLNRDYYSVKLNAEQTEPIRFSDSVYTYNPTLGNGLHNLAYHLGKEANTVSFPTLVILNANMDAVYRYPSFINVLNLEEVLEMYR